MTMCFIGFKTLVAQNLTQIKKESRVDPQKTNVQIANHHAVLSSLPFLSSQLTYSCIDNSFSVLFGMLLLGIIISNFNNKVKILAIRKF